MIRIGQLVGAAQVVVGSLQLDDDDARRPRAQHRARHRPRPGRCHRTRAAARAVRDLRARSRGASRRRRATSSDEIERQHPPVAVVRGLHQGPARRNAGDRDQLSERRAGSGSPRSIARASRCGTCTPNRATTSGRSRRCSAVPADSPLARRARFLAGLSQLNLKKHDDAFADVQGAGRRAADADRAEQSRRRATAPRGDAANRPADVSTSTRPPRPIPTTPDYLFNLGYAYWLDRDPQAAIYWLREAVRRNPADGDAHFVLGAALAAGGQRRPKPRANGSWRAGCRPPTSSGTSGPAPMPVPKGLERVKNDVELPHARRIETRLTTTEQRDQEELAQFYLDRGRRLFQQENDRDAVVELNHALYLSPYLAEAHLLLGRIHLRNGRVTRRSTRSRFRCGAPRPPRRTRRSARRTGRPRIWRRRAPRPSARSRSIPRRAEREAAARAS